MNGYSWYWVWWIIAVIGSFLPVELYAIFTDAKNTLSWNIWRFEGFIPGQAFTAVWSVAHWVVGLASLMLFFWLAVHFAFGCLA